MGVMACSRSGCDTVMCNICIDGIGYVCYYCKTEFEKYLREENIKAETEFEICRELKKLMKTTRNDCDNESPMSVSEFFSKHER